MTRQLTARNVTEVICGIDLSSFARKCFKTLAPDAEFLPNWHIYALVYQLERVLRGEVKRLNVNFPPRTLKSFICSVVLPAFILGHDPTKRIIVLSYSAELAIKLSNDFRTIINAPWYQALFPHMQISRTKNTEFEVATTRNGFRLGASIEGSVTGRGADFMIIDDPIKPMDALSDSKRERVNELFNTTLHNRLDNPQFGAIIVVMQRLHPDDLSGMLQRSLGKCTTLSFLAIAEREETIQIGKYDHYKRHIGDVLHPARESRESLAATRSQIGTSIFLAQYQQNPVSPENMIKPESIHRYDRLPTRTSASFVVQSWDPSSKDGESNDYSACATLLFQQQKIYLVHMLRERISYTNLRNRAIAHARTYSANLVMIEDAGVGTPLIEELKQARLPVQAVRPQYDKKIRMAMQAGKLRDGTLLLPGQAVWLAELEAELFAFPRGRHDDQVDSLSQGLTYEPANDFDIGRLADGMGRLASTLMFQQRVVVSGAPEEG
jgi:predicted phage terminase large subunit-like protein